MAGLADMGAAAAAIISSTRTSSQLVVDADVGLRTSSPGAHDWRCSCTVLPLRERDHIEGARVEAGESGVMDETVR